MNSPVVDPAKVETFAKQRPRVLLQCHGYPSISVNGRVITVKLKRGLALLVLLSELGRKISRLQLADILWSEASPDVSRPRLRRLCHEVNSLLGMDVVTGDVDAVWLNGSICTVASDVGAARDASLQLLASLESKRTLTSLEYLLVPGNHQILNGFDIDSEAFSLWLDVRRSEQERLVCRALCRAANGLVGLGHLALAAEAAQRLVALDPCGEVGHSALMIARAHLGDAAGVETAYFACAEMLRGELGIRPSVQVETAYAQAKMQLDAPTDQPASQCEASPPIRFANTADGAVAYLELGAGPETLIILFGLWSNVEVAWEEPRIRSILDRLALRYRVVLMDRRGTGLSERMSVKQTLSAGVEDINAVRIALGVDKVWLLGNSMGGGIAIEFAATHPENTQGLILYASNVRGSWAEDYPWALSKLQLEKWLGILQTSWGKATSLKQFAPSVSDNSAAKNFWARMLRQSESQNSMATLLLSFSQMDVRSRLTQIDVPTLIVHREGDLIVRADAANYIASRIRNSKVAMLPGSDHLLWYGDTDAALNQMEEFMANPSLNVV